MKVLLLLVICCLFLVGAEDWDVENAECKNNDGKIVPCQTSEEHINILTRALGRSTIDQRLAPNSYWATVDEYGVNHYLRTYSNSFKTLNPSLTFGRMGKDSATLNTDDIFYEKFSSIVNYGKLKNILDGAQKIVFLAHGFWAGDRNGCSSTWQREMAEDIKKVEGEKVVTVVLCWDSDPIEAWGLERSGLQSRFDLISGFSNICQGSYNVWGSYYYSVTSTAKLGELLGSMMKVIKQETSITYFHGIGHSLGAHIMGNVWNFGEFKMNRISGLDPAGPCFDGNTGDITIEKGTGSVEDLWGLHKNAAYFVDNYHTNGDLFGTTKTKGHLNLFAGNPEDSGLGAGEQPTCSTATLYNTCYHSKSYEYYARSIDIGQDYERFSTYYMMRCGNRDSYGYLTDRCRRIGQIDASKYTYVGYHADKSGWDDGNREDVSMYLPIADAYDDWKGPCEIAWNYCPRQAQPRL